MRDTNNEQTDKKGNNMLELFIATCESISFVVGFMWALLFMYEHRR